MRMKSNSQFRGASLLLVLLPFATILLLTSSTKSTCLASPVPVPNSDAAEVIAVEVELEMDAAAAAGDDDDEADQGETDSAKASVNKINETVLCVGVLSKSTFHLHTLSLFYPYSRMMLMRTWVRN